LNKNEGTRNNFYSLMGYQVIKGVGKTNFMMKYLKARNGNVGKLKIQRNFPGAITKVLT
jgi:hypothetical protein